mgnify:CR=1 FL=1
MTTENELAAALAAAQSAGTKSVDQSAYATLDRAGAYRVQLATAKALGVEPAMLKVAVAPDKIGSVAPIYAGRVGDSGKTRLPSANVTGLEVEVGVELKSDLPPGSDAAAVEAAVGRYYMGIEVCGTRYADRTKSAYDVGLADNMSAFGYVIDQSTWEHDGNLEGLHIVLTFNGETIWDKPAKHGFGTVLASVIAYAALPEQPYPLKAGTLVTTGSLCGLVQTSGPGKGVAKMGGHTVEVELI